MSTVSTQWTAIATLRPVKLPGIEFMEQTVRDEQWLFVHNSVTGQHARINSLALQVVLELDGLKTVFNIVERLESETDDEGKEAIAASLIALSQLGMIGLGDEKAEVRIQHRVDELRSSKASSWYNPLAIRIPLLDPDKALETIHAKLRPVLTRWLLWAVSFFIISAFSIAVLNASEILNQLATVASTPQQWWQLLFVYPVLKAAHELAHAISIKRFGGAVHEAGITVLVLMPVPYVDATDIWRFDRRHDRILVCASGMIAEGILASIGFLIWLTVEPGLLANMGFAIALTGSVSTLLLNANPLLKFDGYHILQDTLDMPNLAPRASRYLSYI